MACPLLESSTRTAVTMFHFAYWSLTFCLPSTYSIRSIVRSSIRIRESSPTTNPHVVHAQKSLDSFFLGRRVAALDHHAQLRPKRNTGVRIVLHVRLFLAAEGTTPRQLI